MLLEEIKIEIDKINKYLKECMWMDFDFSDINHKQIKIIGSIDLCWKDYQSIEIFFLNPTFISTILFEWHLHEKKEFIEIANEDEYYKKCGVIPDPFSYMFKINADGYDEAPIWIVAKAVIIKILKQPNDGISIKNNY